MNGRTLTTVQNWYLSVVASGQDAMCCISGFCTMIIAVNILKQIYRSDEKAFVFISKNIIMQ